MWLRVGAEGGVSNPLELLPALGRVPSSGTSSPQETLRGPLSRCDWLSPQQAPAEQRLGPTALHFRSDLSQQSYLTSWGQTASSEN